MENTGHLQRVLLRICSVFALRRSVAGALVHWVDRHKVVISLAALALLSRLPLMSGSLVEIDSANFVNALTHGYNVPLLRPHPPGYPVYIFMGWTVNGIVNDPLLSLTLLSAILGSLAVIPFYSLLRDFAGAPIALVGTLLFIFNPLFWTFSEAALSDVPSVFFVLLLAWLAYRGRRSDAALMWASCLAALAIGVRVSNVAMLLLLAFPFGYRLIVLKNLSGLLTLRSAGLFAATVGVWAGSMIYLGSDGLADYTAALEKQWSTAVRIYGITYVESPWLLNALYRFERFFSGYFFTIPWTGIDARTPLAIALATPWVFGFGLFIVSFRRKSPEHLFLLLWIGSVVYTVVAIHFLPRYGLIQLPGFIIATMVGYRFFATTLLKHPRRLEVISLVGIGTMLILIGIKYQPPIATFEFTPPGGGYLPAAALAAGILTFVGASWLGNRRADVPAGSSTDAVSPGRRGWRTQQVLVAGALVLLVIPVAVRGYSLVSDAHRDTSPNQQLVEYVIENFDPDQITVCWDNQTHSYFEVLMPQAFPVGYWSLNELSDAYDAGRTLIVTDRCIRYSELVQSVELFEVAEFEGTNPAWSKARSLRLYATRLPE